MTGTSRRVTRNVKRWRDAGIDLRWGAASMIEANKSFRRKVHKQLSALRAALRAHQGRMTVKPVTQVTRAAKHSFQQRRPDAVQLIP